MVARNPFSGKLPRGVVTQPPDAEARGPPVTMRTSADSAAVVRPTEANRPWVAAAAWMLVALGVLLQLRHFAGARPLWLDEAMVALNLRYLSPQELLGRLDYQQMAPAGWLQLEKLLLALPVAPEYSLRLVSFAASVGALVMFRQAAFLIVGGTGALAATALFALSPSLVRYAAEVKPYAVDVFAAVLILWLAAGVLLNREAGRRDIGLLALIGAAAIPFSFPIVFVLGGVGGVLFVQRLASRRRGEAALLAVAGLLWLALFAALMTWIYAPQLAGSGLRSGEADNFFNLRGYPPLPPHSLAELTWYFQWAHRIVQFLFTKEARIPLALALMGGAIFLARRRRWETALVFAPLIAALAASSLRAYPLVDRLALFLLPNLVLLAGAGVGWLANTSRAAPAALAILTFVCAGGGVAQLIGNLRGSPSYDIQNVRGALETLRKEAAPRDLIYVSSQGIPAYLFYREAYGLSEIAWAPGKQYQQGWSCIAAEIPGLGSPRRVWMLILLVEQPDAPSSEALALALGLRNLVGRLELRSSGQNVWLYSLRAAPRDRQEQVRTVAAPAACGTPGDKFSPPRRLAERMGLEETAGLRQ